MSTFGSAVGRLAPPRRQRRHRQVASLRLRARVLMRRERLDALLAQGADPVAEEELALRAFQITSLPHRTRLADSLEETIAGAQKRRRRSPAAAPLARQGIAAASPELLALADALRRERIVSPGGVVLAARLLTDGAGPLYVEWGDDGLRRAARGVLAALRSR